MTQSTGGCQCGAVRYAADVPADDLPQVRSDDYASLLARRAEAKQ